MTNGRYLATGAAAIAAFVLVGGGLTYLATRDDASPSGQVQPPERSGSRRMVLGAMPAPGLPGPVQSLRATAANAPRAGSVAAAPGPVTESRRLTVRTARSELIAGLGALRDPVARCGATDAGFILELEALDGAVRVQAARVEEPGAATSGALACAQSALGGQVFPAPSISAGRRWEIPFAVASAGGPGTGVP